MPTSCTTYTSSGQVVNLTYNLPPSNIDISQTPVATPITQIPSTSTPNFLFTRPGKPPPPISLASLNPLPPTTLHNRVDSNETAIYDYVQPGPALPMGMAARLSSLTSPTPPSTSVPSHAHPTIIGKSNFKFKISPLDGG